MANTNPWDCELRANNKILLAEKRQWMLLSSIFFETLLYIYEDFFHGFRFCQFHSEYYWFFVEQS